MSKADRSTGHKVKFISHKAAANHLKPGTKYRFRVGNGQEWSGIGSFTTDTEQHRITSYNVCYTKLLRIGAYNGALRSLKAKGTEEHIKVLYPSNPALMKQLERSLQDRIRVADEYVELSIKSNRGYEEEDYAVYAEYLLKSMEWRDQAMLDNLIWLATEVYP